MIYIDMGDSDWKTCHRPDGNGVFIHSPAVNCIYCAFAEAEEAFEAAGPVEDAKRAGRRGK